MMQVSIRVNREHVAEIQAQRQDSYQDSDTYHTYEYTVKYYATPKDPMEARTPLRDPGDVLEKSGIIQHKYSDGALVLLRKILNDVGLTI